MHMKWAKVIHNDQKRLKVGRYDSKDTCQPDGRPFESSSKSGCLFSSVGASGGVNAATLAAWALLRFTRSRLCRIEQKCLVQCSNEIKAGKKQCVWLQACVHFICACINVPVKEIGKPEMNGPTRKGNKYANKPDSFKHFGFRQHDRCV